MTEQVKQLPSKDEVQKIAKLFELLIQIDQRERKGCIPWYQTWWGNILIQVISGIIIGLLLRIV